jgi:hypothetical protein
MESGTKARSNAESTFAPSSDLNIRRAAPSMGAMYFARSALNASSLDTVPILMLVALPQHARRAIARA